MKFYSLLIFIALSSTAQAQTPEIEGRALAEKLRHAAGGYGDQTVTILMELTSASGQSASRQIRVSTLERSEQNPYSLIVFDSPADVRGTALLSQGREQWLYLPSSERVRRITTSNRSGAFVGSELSYEDLTSTAVDDFEWRALGAAACGAATCQKLESRPKDPESGYSRRVLWLDATTRRPVQIDFFDRKEALQKTLTYSDWKTFDGAIDRAQTWTMVNHLTGKQTVLRFRDFKFKSGLGESDFSQAKLKNVR